MSLEAAIKELTTKIEVLTEVMTSGGVAVVNGKKNPSAKVQAAESEDNEPAPPKFIEKEVAAAKAKGSITKDGPKPPAAAKPAATKPAKTDAYAPVKKAILDAIAAGHRKSITDMLAEYDAKSGQDLQPDVYDEVLEKVAAIVGGEVEELA